jgi:hypothetical protein
MLSMVNAVCGVIDEAFGFAEFLAGAGLVLFAMVLAFLAYAASRSPDNPLRVVAGLLVARLGMTLGIGIVDVPLALVEPLGGIIDVGSLLFLVGYWVTFFIKAARAFMPPPAPPVLSAPFAQTQPQIIYVPQPPHDQSVTLLQPGDD